jgi:hypothetical protein
MMAERATTSKRSSTSSGNGTKPASSRRRTGSWRQTGSGRDGARPAQEALRAQNDADREYRRYEHREEEDRVGPPDVLLDVPELRIDSIHFELDNLDAHVALKAQVLNLVKLNVGVDVHLSKTALDIKGVEAQVVLKARLDHVTAIVDRLMTSLDRNPELVKGLSRAVSDIGEGAGKAVDKTGDAAKDVGKGAQSALEDVGQGAGEATGDIGQGAGQAVGDVGQGAGQAVGDVGQGAGQAVGDVGQGAGQAVGDVGQLVGGVGQTLGQAGQGAGQAGGAVTQALGGAGQAQPQGDAQTNGGGPPRPGALAKEAAKLAARELGHAASDEARDLGLAATRKMRELGERREQRRAEKYHATEHALHLADELGVDIAEIEGSGSEGRVTVRDVRKAQEV